MSEENTDLEVHDFELIIGDAGGVIDNGDVPIRWCLTPEYVRKLEADGIVDPHVLITSYAAGEGNNGQISHCLEMDRKLVPLTELMTYLRFYRAGEMKVIGIILNGASGREVLHKKYMKKSYGEYSNIVHDWDGTLYEKLEYAYATTSELVEIPANVFGKEPSPWVKWYVNLWHGSSKAADECDYRKRMMLAFGLKWLAVIPYVFFMAAIRVVLTGIIAAAGYHKKTYFLRSFRMFKYPSASLNLFDMPIFWIDDNFFIYQRKFMGGNLLSSITSTAMLTGLAFTPILVALISVIVLFLQPAGVVGFLVLVGGAIGSIAASLLFVDTLLLLVELGMRHKTGQWLIDNVYNAFRFLTYGKRADYWFYILVAIIGAALAGALVYLEGLIGMLAVLVVVMVILSIIMFVFGDKIGEWLDRQLTIPASENDYSKAAALLCPDEEDNLRPNINYIPKNKRTLRLRFLDFKNKVCKPMQR